MPLGRRDGPSYRRLLPMTNVEGLAPGTEHGFAKPEQDSYDGG